jgi:hypothetical protein
VLPLGRINGPNETEKSQWKAGKSQTANALFYPTTFKSQNPKKPKNL